MLQNSETFQIFIIVKASKEKKKKKKVIGELILIFFEYFEWVDLIAYMKNQK